MNDNPRRNSVLQSHNCKPTLAPPCTHTVYFKRLCSGFPLLPSTIKLADVLIDAGWVFRIYQCLCSSCVREKSLWLILIDQIPCRGGHLRYIQFHYVFLEIHLIWGIAFVLCIYLFLWKLVQLRVVT